MTPKKIANLVLTAGLLSFGAASCDVIDPWDPGNGGGGNGGGGNGGGCGDTTVINRPEEIVKATGTIHLVTGLEGTMFWAIDGTDGAKYEPTNLPEQFMQDGLKVEFAAYLLKDWSSINQYGQLIEIVEIYNVD